MRKMKKWKKKRMVAVLLTLLVLLQFPADFGSVAHAARKKEIRGTISVASNISQQDMQQYLDGFHKKYPDIEVKYQSYSDYDNEVSKQIQDGDYPDVLFVPGSVPGEKYADYFEKLGMKKELDKKYNYLESSKMSRM
jgi:ABC-type glycerol-3-phosphate transport system substrate-binding protein